MSNLSRLNGEYRYYFGYPYRIAIDPPRLGQYSEKVFQRGSPIGIVPAEMGECWEQLGSEQLMISSDESYGCHRSAP
jgi:hypothetical protein